MKTIYRGYVIDVTPKNDGALWSAEAWIWPEHDVPRALREKVTVDGCTSESEAEEAARQKGEKRIDSYILNQIPTR